MKKFLFIAVFSFSLTQMFAQEMRYDTLAYLFPKLSEGKFTLNDGGQLTTLFNYGFRYQDILYYDNETKEILQANIKDIAMIRAGGRYFIPIYNGIGELIVSGDIGLVYYKQLKVDESKKSIGYGSSSSSAANIRNTKPDIALQTASNNPLVTHYFTTDPNQKLLSDKVAEGELKVVIQEDYYLSELGSTKVIPLTKKNLIKMFPQHASFIENYFAENKPDLKSRYQVMHIVDMLNAM